MRKEIVPGQRVTLKPIEWFSENAVNGVLNYGWRNYSEITEKEYKGFLGKILVVGRISNMGSDNEFFSLYQTTPKGKADFNSEELKGSALFLDVVEKFAVQPKQINACEKLLKKFDRIFVEQIGSGGGDGELLKLTTENVFPSFNTETGILSINIPGKSNNYNLPISQLKDFMETKTYSHDWQATQHTRVSDRYALVAIGEVYKKSNYNWQSRGKLY